MTETIKELHLRRFYIGGLSKDVTEKDLYERFTSFGEVARVDIVRHPDTGECRGFAYISVNTTDSGWQRCIKIFNGAKWKGMTLKIQDAKPDYRQRLKDEWELQKEKEKLTTAATKQQKKRKKKRGDANAKLAEDMSIITDNNIHGRKNWKRTIDGRAVTIMHMRKPDGSKVIIDPSQYKNNFQKLFDTSLVKPKPLHELIFQYEEKYDRRFTTEKGLRVKILVSPRGDNSTNQTMEYFNDHYGNEGLEHKSGSGALPLSIIDDLRNLMPNKNSDEVSSRKEQSNNIRLQALKQRGQEEREKKAKIGQALRKDPELKTSKGHIKFSDSENDASDKMSLFSTGDEELMDEVPENIEINPIFEGDRGRERLNLQKGFRGDQRFKLTKDFMDDLEKLEDENFQANKDSSNHNIQKQDRADDNISETLDEEKLKSMGILKSMFGMDIDKPNLSSPNFLWNEMIHFDPDGPAEKILRANREEPDEFEEIPVSKSFVSPLPQVSKDVKVEINTNLKTVFAQSTSQAASFSLFGHSEDQQVDKIEKENATEKQAKNKDDKPIFSSFIEKLASPTTAKATVTTTKTLNPLFFFHFGDEALSKRTHYRETNIFMRTSPMEKIIEHWENTRGEMTQEFKRKHRSPGKVFAAKLVALYLTRNVRKISSENGRTDNNSAINPSTAEFSWSTLTDASECSISAQTNQEPLSDLNIIGSSQKIQHVSFESDNLVSSQTEKESLTAPKLTNLRRSSSMDSLVPGSKAKRPLISYSTLPNMQSNLSNSSPKASQPLTPLMSIGSKIIQELIVSSAINMNNAAKLSSDSAHPPLNLQTTTINFKKFVQKCGFIFALQDSVENLILWKNSANTLLAMVIYVYICIYPHLMILLPLVGLLSLLISFYHKRFPKGPAQKLHGKHWKKHRKRQSDPFLPAENSVDYLKNMQNIQNMMGMISDAYDALIPVLKHLDWSNEEECLRITQIAVLTLALLTGTVWFIPWRKVFIVFGLSIFVANNKFVKVLLKETSPLLFQRIKIMLALWSKSLTLEEEDELEQDEITISVFENQRWWTGDGFRPLLLRSERAPWSSMSGTTGLPSKEDFPVPLGYEWVEDWSLDMDNLWEDENGAEEIVDPDEGGWVYTDHQWENTATKSISGPKLVTRRRKWIRKAKKVNIGSNSNSSPINEGAS
ncbi:hypothetical protein G9A89_018582 [Geosiphon pyriformis]|nr:hypothetical protein G9A89_018582 [Geosiphon pyriformis]